MADYRIDRTKWSRLSIFEQMGNIGSEVGRAFDARRKGDSEQAQAAFYRGLDLLDASAEVWAAQKSPRTREILRAREQFVSAMDEKELDSNLEAYFMQFAIAARLRQA